MEEEKKKAYSEVVEILKLIDNEEKIEKIPFEVIELIKNNSDPEYKPTINMEEPLENQNLMDETYSILAWIASKYWNEKIITEPRVNEQVQQESNEVLNEQNEIGYSEDWDKQNISEIKLNPRASVYNDIDPEILERCEQQEKLPAIRTNINWFIKIKEKVIKILKLIFRVKDMKEENY